MKERATGIPDLLLRAACVYTPDGRLVCVLEHDFECILRANAWPLVRMSSAPYQGV